VTLQRQESTDAADSGRQAAMDIRAAWCRLSGEALMVSSSIKVLRKVVVSE